MLMAVSKRKRLAGRDKMRLPWQKCKHKEIHIDWYDHGIEQITIVTCLKCKEVLCEEVGPFILGEPEDDI